MHWSWGPGYWNNFTPRTGISPTRAIAFAGYVAAPRTQLLARIHRLPANIPRLVNVRNLVSCLRLTYRSSAVRTENSSLHNGSTPLICRLTRLSFPHVIDHVEDDAVFSRR